MFITCSNSTGMSDFISYLEKPLELSCQYEVAVTEVTIPLLWNSFIGSLELEHVYREDTPQKLDANEPVLPEKLLTTENSILLLVYRAADKIKDLLVDFDYHHPKLENNIRAIVHDIKIKGIIHDGYFQYKWKVDELESHANKIVETREGFKYQKRYSKEDLNEMLLILKNMKTQLKNNVLMYGPPNSQKYKYDFKKYSKEEIKSKFNEFLIQYEQINAPDEFELVKSGSFNKFSEKLDDLTSKIFGILWELFETDIDEKKDDEYFKKRVYTIYIECEFMLNLMLKNIGRSDFVKPHLFKSHQIILELIKPHDAKEIVLETKTKTKTKFEMMIDDRCTVYELIREIEKYDPRISAKYNEDRKLLYLKPDNEDIKIRIDSKFFRHVIYMMDEKGIFTTYIKTEQYLYNVKYININCDITTAQQVENGYERRLISISPEGSQAETFKYKPNVLEYISVNRTYINSINIMFKDQNGSLINFIHGPIEVKLHFRIKRTVKCPTNRHIRIPHVLTHNAKATRSNIKRQLKKY